MCHYHDNKGGSLGNITGHLSMMIIGGILSHVKIKKYLGEHVILLKPSIQPLL